MFGFLKMPHHDIWDAVRKQLGDRLLAYRDFPWGVLVLWEAIAEDNISDTYIVEAYADHLCKDETINEYIKNSSALLLSSGSNEVSEAVAKFMGLAAKIDSIPEKTIHSEKQWGLEARFYRET